MGHLIVPIPGMDWTDEPFRDRAVWRLRFMWRPKRSAITGHWLWLCHAYEGIAMWTGPGDTVLEFRYHERIEHLIWNLKN